VAESVQVEAAQDPADRVQLHVAYADEAVTALRDAARKHDGAGYRAALMTLVTEDQAAVSEVAALPPGDQRTSLMAQVVALRVRERDALRAALSALGWSDRIMTTSALGGLGAIVPRITAAMVSREEKTNGGKRGWQVTISGEGFQTGAVLLIDGQEKGQIVSVTDRQLVAMSDKAAPAHVSLGVGNPDGTAASTDQITRDTGQGGQSNGQATPNATPTHGKSNSHSGNPPNGK
jgi:hypothetical protein